MNRIYMAFAALGLVSCSSNDSVVQPVAVDDQVYGFRSETTTWSDLTANDRITGAAAITAVFDDNTAGLVSLNSDGSVSYTPGDGFAGEDSFTYELCASGGVAPCSRARVYIYIAEALNVGVPEGLESYYSDLRLSTHPDFNRVLLSDHITGNHNVILTYGQRHNFLYDADEDLDNPESVILMYTGESRYWKEYQSGNNSYSPQTFNTEHVYPQSLLSAEDGVTDLHHLRVADAEVNSERSNFPFAEGNGENQLIGTNAWYPGDEWRGDVARMIMYLNLRYSESFGKVGNLQLFIKWNREDPVSLFELQRNRVIQGAQGNRNPFIDNPYLATLIWGGEPAQNRWE